MEIGNDNRLNFLDTTLIMDNKRIIFDIYHKTFRESSWISNHPLYHKRGIIINFVDKIFLLSHPRFQYNNLVEAIYIFLNNGYPLPFIFSTIENRLKFHIHTINILHTIYKSKKNFLQFYFPYVKSIFESFSPISNMFHCKLAFLPTPWKVLLREERTS